MKKKLHLLIHNIPTIQKIILFGSYSKKKPRYGSDVDLLIVVSRRIENDFDIIYETLYNISADFEWSPLILTETRFNELETEPTYFFKETLKDGTLLFRKVRFLIYLF